jgi:hypothetical protein
VEIDFESYNNSGMNEGLFLTGMAFLFFKVRLMEISMPTIALLEELKALRKISSKQKTWKK